MWTNRSGLLQCTYSRLHGGAWHDRRREHQGEVLTVETVHSGDRKTLHELYNKYINVYNIYSYAYKYKYILYIIFIYIYTQRHVRPCESSNDRSTPAWPAVMSITAETLGFLASRGGDSRYRSGVLRARVLVLFFGGVGIEYSLPTENNSIIHASTQVKNNLVFGLR